MDLETLSKGNAINRRLRDLEMARGLWEQITATACVELRQYVGDSCVANDLAGDVTVPAPVAAFRRACLDYIATEEAALRAQLAAL